MEVRAQQLDLAARAEFAEPDTYVTESRAVIREMMAGPVTDPVELEEIYTESANDLAILAAM